MLCIVIRITVRHVQVMKHTRQNHRSYLIVRSDLYQDFCSSVLFNLNISGIM